MSAYPLFLVIKMTIMRENVLYASEKKTIRKFIVDSYVHNWQIEKKSSFFSS